MVALNIAQSFLNPKCLPGKKKEKKKKGTVGRGKVLLYCVGEWSSL